MTARPALRVVGARTPPPLPVPPPGRLAVINALADVLHALRGLPAADAAEVVELARHCVANPQPDRR